MHMQVKVCSEHSAAINTSYMDNQDLDEIFREPHCSSIADTDHQYVEPQQQPAEQSLPPVQRTHLMQTTYSVQPTLPGEATQQLKLSLLGPPMQPLKPLLSTQSEQSIHLVKPMQPLQHIFHLETQEAQGMSLVLHLSLIADLLNCMYYVYSLLMLYMLYALCTDE